MIRTDSYDLNNIYDKALFRSLSNRFPVGQKVQLTKHAIRQFPKYKDRVGEVVGYLRNVFIKVKFDDVKNVSAWSPDYFEVAQ